MTSAQLRAATVTPNALVPVLVEGVDGQRHLLSGWRLEGSPNGCDDCSPPKTPSPYVLVLELSPYQEDTQ
jgi:hypothetical protein